MSRNSNLRAAPAFLLAAALALTAGEPAHAQTAAARREADFAVRHRPLDPLVAVIRSHMSEKGELHLLPQAGAFRVVDAPDRVDAVRRLVAGYDVPLRRVEAMVKLIEASQDPRPAQVSESIRSIGTRLQNVLRFSRYELLDTLVLEGLEGRDVSGHLAERYRMSFALGHFLEDGRVIPVENLRLDKTVPPAREGQPPAYQNLLTTALNLMDGEEIMMGASRMDAASDRALVVVISVKVMR